MNIQPKVQNLSQIFTGIDTQYRVPAYQRDYSWQKQNTDELWEDLLLAFQSMAHEDYFMGPIVLNTEPIREQGYREIVDGQQRLVTFSILFSVLRNYAESWIDDSQTSTPMKEVAKSIFLMANNRLRDDAEPDKVYLQLTEKDHNEYLRSILNDKAVAASGIKKPDHRIIKARKIFNANIQSFLNEASSRGRDPHSELKALTKFLITKIVFMVIEVSGDYDAYLIFESLNSKGLDLSTADLLKNRLLLLVASDKNAQSAILKNWNELHDMMSGSRFSLVDFIYFFWRAFYNSKCTKKQLYKDIKERIKTSDALAFTERLNKAGDWFSAKTDSMLMFPSTSYKFQSTERRYAEINTLGYSSCYPLLLKITGLKNEPTEALLDKIIAYLFRMVTIGDFSVGRAEDTFRQAIAHLDGGRPVDELDQFFTDPEATDDKFAERFSSTSFNNNSLAKYVLVRIDMHRAGNTYVLNSQQIHLEHVLPVKPDLWLPEFDVNGREIEDWIRSIGNMTILESELNQSIRNASFVNKMEKLVAIGSSGTGALHNLTKQIIDEYSSGNLKVWNHDYISKRAKSFAEDAKAIWHL